MAVFQRRFHPYSGELTSAWRRILVPTRYALSDLLRSKLFVVFLTCCFIYPLMGLMAIYLRHNVELLKTLLNMGIEIEEWMPIDTVFFGVFLRVQGVLAFFLVLFSGPRLVSRDLANNGLALYLCRPFSKAQYVAGKLAVLAGLVSLVTWIPGLLLWAVQAGLQSGWGPAHLDSAIALFVGSWVWIVVLGFLALAVSAWVRWRPVAGFLLLLIFFGGGLVARIVELLFHSDWGYALDLHHDIRRVWTELFATSQPFFFGAPPVESPAPAWIALGVFVAVSLLLLARRIRAYEVVS